MATAAVTVDFTMQSHDLLPSIQATLKNPDGSIVDLTSATSVKFILLAANTDWTPANGASPTVSSAAVIVAPATSGVVRYDWAVGDTATAGQYLGQWQVTWPTNRPQSFPTATYYAIQILADLDGA